MLKLYRYLLLLYPISYREEFADEMTYVFLEAYGSSRDGAAMRARFYGREIIGVLAGALREHLRMTTGCDPIPFRRLSMQRQYHFPKSTAIFMCLSLLAVVVAISKADSVVKQYSHVPLGVPGWIASFSLSFAVICVAVAIATGLLFALHRSGVQRLESLQSWPAEK